MHQKAGLHERAVLRYTFWRYVLREASTFSPPKGALVFRTQMLLIFDRFDRLFFFLLVFPFGLYTVVDKPTWNLYSQGRTNLQRPVSSRDASNTCLQVAVITTCR